MHTEGLVLKALETAALSHWSFINHSDSINPISNPLAINIKDLFRMSLAAAGRPIKL